MGNRLMKDHKPTIIALYNGSYGIGKSLNEAWECLCDDCALTSDDFSAVSFHELGSVIPARLEVRAINVAVDL